MRQKHRGRRGRAGARGEKCPCDFDLVRTPDVGQCGGSRPGVSYLLQRYLATAAVAVRTVSIVFLLSPRSRPPQLCGHQQGRHPPPPTPVQLSLACLSRACSSVHSVTLVGDGNHRKPASSLTGRFETQSNISVHELTAPTSSNITSCEQRRDTLPPGGL